MKKLFLRIVALFATSAILLSCENGLNNKYSDAEISTTEAGNTLIVTDKFSAVILTKEIMETLSPMIGGPEYWTPEVEQVLFLESKLGKYITQNESRFNSGHAPSAEELTRYVRQYYGVKYNEIVDLRVVFFCPTSIQNEDWNNRALTSVHGGGDCMFGAVYDMKTKEFIDFAVSSPR